MRPRREAAPPSRTGGRAPRNEPARDMDATPFAPILNDLLARLPGAYAAALVDAEGETVDYAGMATPFDVKVAAAHLQIVLQQLARFAALGEPRSLVIRGAARTVIMRSLPDGYGLAVLLRRRAGFTASRRAFAVCERALAREAAWRAPTPAAIWYPVTVVLDVRGRPARIAAVETTSVAVEVLGAVVGLPKSERGFRVRTADGVEVTLVREARDCWYADEDLGGRVKAQPQ